MRAPPESEDDASFADSVLALLCGLSWIPLLFAGSLAIARYLVLYFEVDGPKSDPHAAAFGGGFCLGLVSVAMIVIRIASKEWAAKITSVALVFWLIAVLIAGWGCVFLPSRGTSLIADCAIVSLAYLLAVSVSGVLVTVPLDVLVFKASSAWRRGVGRRGAR